MNRLMGHGAVLSSPLTPHQTVFPIQKTGFKNHLMDHIPAISSPLTRHRSGPFTLWR
jgi:hypothetical protein